MTKPKTITTIKDLTPDSANANRHTQRGMGLMETSLTECGFGDSLTVDKHGNVISGNGRLETLAGIDMTDAIVVQSDGTRPVVHQRTDLDLTKDSKAKRLAVLQNRVGQTNLEWDAAALAQLADEGVELDDLFSADELTALLNAAEGPGSEGGLLDGVDPDAVPDNAPTRCKLGDLWQLGRHRLLCGDSTKTDAVGRLMGGEKAEMVWTDPPYGVAIGDKNKYLNSLAPGNRIEENLQNDNVSEPDLVAMLRGAFAGAAQYCLAGGAWYVAAPAGPPQVLFGLELKSIGVWRQTIQWVKNNATFSPMGVDYHWRAEPIFYGWLPGAGHRYYGGRKQDTVWEIDRPQKSPDHPTMKPTALVKRAVENSSLSGELVYDPFLGSGTTIIVAEQTGRKCYGMELEPKYCDVILRRWENATGKAAELVTNDN